MPAQQTGQWLCQQATLKLAETDLARSGLTFAQACAEGIFPTDDASAANPDFAAAPALIIPYHDMHGNPVTYLRDGRALHFCRARYLVPPGFPVPRGRKYDQPANSGTPPYFPLCYDWQQVGRGNVTEICCLEGEKKAIALCRAGIPAFATGGVFNYTEGSAALHSAIASIAGNCTDVYVTFDSDAADKPQIQLAERRLAGQLALLGPRPHIVRIPANGPDKVGADDYLIKHGRDALVELIIRTPTVGETAANETADDEITVAEILRREVAPVEELIPGWIEKGIPNFIAGPGGTHKSRLALQWGLCINAGAAVWGLGAAVQGLRDPVASLVYCAAEDDANELARRTQAISAALNLKSPARGLFIARRGADSALVYMHESGQVEVRPFYHRLIQRLRKVPGHKIVVLDSAYDFVRFTGKAKIDEDAVNYFIKVVLQGICDLTDSTLLIPWHPSQAGSGRDAMDGWSVAWHNAPRARLAISAVEGAEDTYELKVVKRNHGPKGQPLTIKFINGALLPLDAVPDDGKAAALRQVFVRAAIEAAGHNVPFNRRDAVPDLVFKEADKFIGRRPSRHEMKNAMEEAIRLGELRYLPNTRHRAAGLYPPDAELAQDLARAARKAARSNADA
ncbi:MAG: AAA family ATPase [Rhizomicrobium sp.]